LNIEDFREDPIENARLCLKMAEEHCKDCGHFHSSSILRRANLVAEDKMLDNDEIESAIALVLRAVWRNQPRPHVIITGSTDTGLLATICRSAFMFGGEDMVRALQITLVDQCDTPLEICRRYADRLGITLNTFRSDFLTFQPQQLADLVFMHGVLRFLPLEKRDDYFKHIATWLHPEGFLISSTHLGDRSSETHLATMQVKVMENLRRLATQGLLPAGRSVETIETEIENGLVANGNLSTTFDDAGAAMAYYQEIGLPPRSFWITSVNRRGALSAERFYKTRGIAICQLESEDISK